MSEIESISFQLIKVTTEQFAIIQESYDDSNESINLTINIRFGIGENSNVIASFVKVSFEQEEKPFVLIEVGNHFKIDPKNWEKIKNDGEGVTVPKGFAQHLVALTIGTMRGVLHCKTENTDFNKFVLPTINVTDLVTKDVLLVD